MSASQNIINKWFEEMVPSAGPADTVAGEIVRAICKIGYRCWNDGDHIGYEYGNETCNAPARYLAENTNSQIENQIEKMWGVWEESDYNLMLSTLEDYVVEYINNNPELKEKPNNDDMLSYTDPSDTDYYEDEEDDWYDDEPEYLEDDED